MNNLSYKSKNNSELSISDVLGTTGFPSPADDFVEQSLDLNQILIKHPAATFFVRIKGDSLQKFGIFANDILVVDRSLDPFEQGFVLALIDDEFTVKKFHKQKVKNSGFEVWGVITFIIHTCV